MFAEHNLCAAVLTGYLHGFGLRHISAGADSLLDIRVLCGRRGVQLKRRRRSAAGADQLLLADIIAYAAAAVGADITAWGLIMLFWHDFLLVHHGLEFGQLIIN